MGMNIEGLYDIAQRPEAVYAAVVAGGAVPEMPAEMKRLINLVCDDSR